MRAELERGRIRLLHGEIRWLMRLRWFAGAAIVVLGLLNALGPRVYPVGAGPVLLGAAVLVYNGAFLFAFRRFPRPARTYPSLLIFAAVQIHLDIGCLMLLTIWTGGLRSPILSAFMFHMLFASLLQPRLRAYGVALVAIAAVSVGLWASGQWPSTPHDRLVGLAWAGMLVVTVYLTNRVTRALYRREVARLHQLERLRAMSARLRSQQDAMVQGEKLAAIGHLAAGIAHEINNPLASMDGLLQLMERHPERPRPGAVATLREQVQRILRIVRQLTAYAHPGTGRLESAPVNEVAASVLELLALDRRARRVRIDRVLSEETGMARMDPQALQQVLTNLLVNSLDATAGREEPRIELRTERQNAHCVVTVTDNGSGIPPEHRARLFEPFFTTKPVGQGTGLGLSICARLVRDHGGRIELQSTSGSGTSFAVILPADTRNARPEAARVPADPWTRARHETGTLNDPAMPFDRPRPADEQTREPPPR